MKRIKKAREYKKRGKVEKNPREKEKERAVVAEGAVVGVWQQQRKAQLSQSA